MKRSLMCLAVLGVLSGCSMIPEYERPASPVADVWPTDEAYATQNSETQAMNLGWQDFFLDPQLQRLIGIALANNRDLRIAALNVEAYRSLYGIQRAALLPDVTADGSGTRTRTPEGLSPTGEATTGGQYSATLGVAWELDLFGRLNSLSAQALEEYLASEATQRSVQISLIASVANSYLTWQADRELLAVTAQTLEAYEDSLSLVQRSYDVGVASTLELTQARTAVETARSAQAQYRRLVAQDRNALTQLLGQNVSLDDVESGGLEMGLLADLPVGLPSELLFKRPDVVAAEHQLLAANASIGAARAAFFPSIRLTGAAGSASNDLSELFDSGSGYWNFMPSISIPIFNAGRLRANLDYTEISRDIRVAEYEQTIQDAFRDVADGLTAHETYADQVQAQRNLLDVSERYYTVAEQRYRTGVDSHLTLLDAQRQLLSAQQQLVNDRRNQLISEVNLFKALGGGWQIEDAAAASAIPEA
ncbi:outer membrane protein, multidrug efflux system [Halopseudomonas litoralis]|uniref:Outer membrane protein, multidrug efflux system n=1 Tax=Halopseudomonas litoralis TaxID=797277 RepID=A0A1H1L5I8_9GAMM|nr:efflux transporter outer membrane subunit [Halopseudomonas litoralis]SDR69562.1 outer membrane protein, multidrug efflux system [Halopseudomonas litoralis]